MKKIGLLSAMIIALAFVFISGCSKDDATKPTITVGDPVLGVGKATFTIDVATTNTELKTIGIAASTQGGTNSTFVADAAVFASQNAVTGTFKAGLKTAKVTYDYVYPANASGKITFTFTITDDKETNTATKEYTIQLVSWGPKTMTCFPTDNTTKTTNNFTWDSNGNQYTLANAQTNGGNIDFVFMDHDFLKIEKKGILAPSDEAVTRLLDAQGFTYSWATKNATVLVKVTPPAGFTFATATNAQVTEMVAATATSTNTRIEPIAVGDIIAFKTVSGKRGIIKVDALAGSYINATLTVSGKVLP